MFSHRKLFYIVIAIVLIILLSFVTSLIILHNMNYDGWKEKRMPINPSASFNLDKKELEKFKVLAMTGNANAAYKVHKYYRMYVGDHIKAERWLYIATLLNHESAKKHLRYLQKRGVTLGIKVFILTRAEAQKQVKSLKKGNAIIALFFLYKHYSIVGNKKLSQKYLDKLKKTSIDKKLITD